MLLLLLSAQGMADTVQPQKSIIDQCLLGRNDMARYVSGKRNGFGVMTRRGFVGGAATVGILTATHASTLGGRAFAQEPARFDLSAHPEFEEIIEGAKQEGGVYTATNLIYEGRDTLPGLFRQYYGLPDNFRVEIVNKGAAQIAKQIQEEIAADRVTVDVVLFNILATAKALRDSGELLEFDAPSYAAYAHLDVLGFNDRPFYVSDPFLLTNLAWNGDLDQGNYTAWADLLNPDLEGKISFVNARLASSMAMSYKAMRETPEIGDRFFHELAKLKPTPFQRAAQCLELVASGEFPMTMIGSNRAYTMKRDLGVNVKQAFPVEGIAPIPVPMFGLRRTQNPNSAKLMLNFLRSLPGQTELAAGEGYTSGRNDLASPNPEFVPETTTLKLLPVDVDMTEADLLALGRDWEAIFGA